MTKLAFPPTHLPAALGAVKVAQTLGTSRRAAEELMLSGLADTLINTDEPTTWLNHLDRLVMNEDALHCLADIPWVNDGHGAAVNVRVRAARCVSDSDREFMGWHSRLNDTDADLAVSRWWPVPRQDPTGHAFVVTIAGFIVRCGRIDGVDTDRNQAAYDVDWEDPDVAAIWSGRRVSTPPGGTVVKL